jgi:hypothetical protein
VTGGTASAPGDGRTAVVAAGREVSGRLVTHARLQPVATVLVDAENVRRSLWPNIPAEQLEELCDRWGERNGHHVVVVWEGPGTADDRIAREVRELDPPVWVVTSDRGLRERVAPYADRLIGGGSFAREIA